MIAPKRLLAPLSIVPILGSCSSLSPDEMVSLGDIYSPLASRLEIERNPVVVIPGILGSKLRDPETGTLVWGAFAPGAADPGTPEGARLIAFPMESGTALTDLSDNIEPDGVLDRLRVRLAPGIAAEPRAYQNILSALGVGGYRDQSLGESGAIDYGMRHYTCFQFSYDWRRPTADNASRLARFLEEKAAEVKAADLEHFGRSRDKVTFDIVAHSLGGLVLRYFLRYGDQPLPADGRLPELTWEGSSRVANAVLIATPNAGSAFAIEQLTKGLDYGLFIPEFPPALIGTLPAVYELLPRARHRWLTDPGGTVLDAFDPSLWTREQWGLLDPRQDAILQRLLPDASSREERVSIAQDHLTKCLRNASALHAALDRPAAPPDSLHLTLFAGDATPTPSSATASESGITLGAKVAGDGTVIRSSALLDESLGTARLTPAPGRRPPIRWDEVHFIHSDHLGITKDATFTDNLLFGLLAR